MLTINLTPRDAAGSKAAELLRATGKMPAVIYSAKHEAISVSLSIAELEAVLRHGGESSVIELTGLDAPIQALIQSLERNPVTNVPRHADFLALEKGAKVTMTVPLTFINEAPAVKLGANLVKVMHEIEVEAAQDKLPHEIEVDLALLAAIGDQIHVSDLKVPAGVTIQVEGEEVVVLAQETAEETEEAPTAIDMDAIEVEKKGKAEEEAE